MNRLRILLLGPSCHPKRLSIPYVTYSHAAALAELHDVTIVARSNVVDDLRGAEASFHGIEEVRMPLFERFEAWFMRRVLKYRYDSQLKSAIAYPSVIAFEWRAWRQLRHRIHTGEFDVAIRLDPMTPTLPSLFAFLLRKGPIPFVIGPLNGGLGWPSGFSQLENQREWTAGLRNLYRWMPFARSTYRDATAIIAASSQTYSEFAKYRDKLFYIPEPGISRSICSDDTRMPEPGAKLELIFVGGLIPLKACDLALRGAATLLRNGVARFTVVGDGRERHCLEELVDSLGIKKAVSFCGWVSQSEVFSRLRSADVFVFPSLKENGGGVVFQALATGAVPVVADFGGPGDIVYPEVGYKVQLTDESDVVSQIEKILTKLAGDRQLLLRLRQQGMSYARERLTWTGKAEDTTQVLNWVVRRGAKPSLLPPKMLDPEGKGRPQKATR